MKLWMIYLIYHNVQGFLHVFTILYMKIFLNVEDYHVLHLEDVHFIVYNWCLK